LLVFVCFACRRNRFDLILQNEVGQHAEGRGAIGPPGFYTRLTAGQLISILSYAGEVSTTLPVILRLRTAVLLGIVLVLVTASATAYQDLSQQPRTNSSSLVTGMSGGCAPFSAIAQNRYPPYGTAIRAQPNALSTQLGSFTGNKAISVNGWVYGTAEYPTNPPPWNSNVWFHLTDGAGWVSFAGVRAYPMTPDPDGLNPDGGPPVAIAKDCQGEVQ